MKRLTIKYRTEAIDQSNCHSQSVQSLTLKVTECGKMLVTKLVLNLIGSENGAGF